MKVIGLTGGIGTGKSTASQYLQKLGFTIIDADRISREVVEPGKPLLAELKTAFGPEIILPEGALDRKALGSIVFSQEEKRLQLERIMHGEILRTIRDRVKEARQSGRYRAAFIDAPLLFETGLDGDCEIVWLITADDRVRIKRVMVRDGLTAEEVQARIDRQMSEEGKRRRADFIVDNSGAQSELYEALDALVAKL